MTYLVAQTLKGLPTTWETWVRSLGWEDLLEEAMATHSSILAWEITGQRSLAGYSPWGCKESDTTERLLLSFTKAILRGIHILKLIKEFTLIKISY